MIHNTMVVLGTEVHYWVHNPGQTRTLVVVHGFRGNHKALTDYAASFENRTVILFDLPGHGRSPNMTIKHSLPNFARFLSKFIDQLGLDTFDLAGHSFGGSIALIYASYRPSSLHRLVLISPAMATSGILVQMTKAYYQFARLMPAKVQKRWLSSKFIDHISGLLFIKYVSPARKAQLIEAGQRNLKETNPPIIIESSLSYLKTDFVTLARRIGSPALVLAGEIDELAPVKRLEKLTDADEVSMKVLPECGHLSPLERPRYVARLTENFIDN